MPANVGVGDVLQYQVAATYYLAFISGRTSDTVYTVQSSTGATPQAAAASTAVNVYRAYTSLSNWQAQNENDTINDTVENFDTSRDLVTANVVMNVACYGDGADTTAVTVSGWTTAATNYIRIFTPVRPAEVGTSQRHPGKWDASKYRLQAGLSTSPQHHDDYASVEGLQVWMTANLERRAGSASPSLDTGVSDYEISNNVVRGNGTGTTDIRIGINLYGAGSGVLKIWNNVIYDLGRTTRTSSPASSPTTRTTPTTSTTTRSRTAKTASTPSVGTVLVAKNNLVYNSRVDNYWTDAGVSWDPSSTNNLSGPTQTDAPGSNPRNVTTVTFVDATGDDFHLAASDTGAQGQGADLSADAGLAFAVDVDRGPRRAPWDIGADEQGAGAPTCSLAPKKPWYNAGWHTARRSSSTTPRSSEASSTSPSSSPAAATPIWRLTHDPTASTSSSPTRTARPSSPTRSKATTGPGTSWRGSRSRSCRGRRQADLHLLRRPLLGGPAERQRHVDERLPGGLAPERAERRRRVHPELGPQQLPRHAHQHRLQRLRQDQRSPDASRTSATPTSTPPAAARSSTVGASSPSSSGSTPTTPRTRSGRPPAEDQLLYGNTGPVRLGRVRRFNYDAPGTGELQIDVQFNTAGTQFVVRQHQPARVEPRRLHLPGVGLLVFFNGVEVYRDVFPNDRLTNASYLLLGLDNTGGP